MAVTDHPRDICECGDYRHQHDAAGRCCFNKPGGIGHGSAPDCVEFRLFRRHGATHLGSMFGPVSEPHRSDDEAAP